MYHDFSFREVLATSQRAGWQLDEVLPPGAKLDFSCTFMPEALARTAVATMLSADEQRVLNQIRGHEYLTIFGLVEEFILPFLMDHMRPQLSSDDYRVRALLQFAGEEAKHIHLFKRFQQVFANGFGTPCDVIGPPEAIAAEVLRHDPLAVALLILHIEWMTQAHYLESVHDDGSIDPLFKSLLRHHWIEEAQHAKLDTLIVEQLAAGRDETSIAAAVEEYLEIGGFLDGGLKAQSELNLAALERAIGRSLPSADRTSLMDAQHQALRFTYIASGMTHPRFTGTLESLSSAAAARIAAVAPAFC
jgi:para-aminobenzoate N-oxygenase AurF